MLKTMIAALAGTIALTGTASAATIGNLGEAGFTYGTLSGGAFNSYGFHAAGSSECLGLGDCYTGGDKYAIVAASANAGELLVHPGPGAGGNSAVSFTVGSAGRYALDALGTSYDFGTKNVGYFSIVNGTLTTFTAGSVGGGAASGTGGGTPGSSQAIKTSLLLGVGDRIGVFVDNAGDYTGDTTHFSGSIAAVPEPATWAMMIGGVGMVGGAMRRRRSSTGRTVLA